MSVRGLQAAVDDEKGQVLSKAREANPTGARRLGLFSGAGNNDDRRDDPPREAPLPNGIGDFDGSVREELLRLMRLPLAELSRDPNPNRTTAGAALARVLLRKAVIDQQQAAITEVLDRIEGKATKAAANKPTNNHIQEQLELSLNDLNKL